MDRTVTIAQDFIDHVDLPDAPFAVSGFRRPGPEPTVFDVALQVTDEILGAGTYARINEHHPDPGVQAATTTTAAQEDHA